MWTDIEKNHPKREWKRNQDILKHAVSFIHTYPVPLKKTKNQTKPKQAVGTNFWKLNELNAGRLIPVSHRAEFIVANDLGRKNLIKGK